jgi:hypothetical protein
MSKSRLFVSTWALALLSSGCGPILHTEMLGESIRTFSSHGFNPGQKVWITNTADSGCDKAGGAQAATGKSGIGGLFSRSTGGPGPYDQLAFEVFANYLTQRKRARVVETHRHNYATELNPDTHRKLEISGDGKTTSGTSPEDLCLLDEAKKRKADKVLVYRIAEMENDKMTIHFRLSDVPSGVVDQAQTMKVENLRAFDYSYGGGRRGGGGGGGD